MINKILIIFTLSLILISPAFAVDDDDASSIFFATSLTGGGSGSLDGAVSGVSIGQNDAAIVVDSNLKASIYKAEFNSAAENSPYVIRPDDVGVGVTSWVLTQVTAVTDYILHNVSASKITSGASIYAGGSSGTTLTSRELNTIIFNDSSTPPIYWLPNISGVSTIYIKFIEGIAASGMTIYPADSEPFMGSSLSGTSHLSLPPGNAHEAATIYGINTGTTTYWYVEKTSPWVSGN